MLFPAGPDTERTKGTIKRKIHNEEKTDSNTGGHSAFVPAWSMAFDELRPYHTGKSCGTAPFRASLTDAIQEVAPEEELFAFRNIKEVLAWAESNTCDVAFLDIRMRGMTGLELALRLKNYWPGVNIIFATGYDEYLLPAVNLRCSGYLLKPIQSNDVREDVDGVSVPFENARCKELLAFLIDRNGAAMNSKEIAAAMYDNSDNETSSLAQIRKAKVNLKSSLKKAGIEDILKEENRLLSVDKTKLSCDYWQMMEGNTEALRAFLGEYMSGYSWAEVTLAGILFQKNR